MLIIGIALEKKGGIKLIKQELIYLNEKDFLKLYKEWLMRRDAVKKIFGEYFRSFLPKELPDVFCPGPNCKKKMEGCIDRKKREIRYKCSSSSCQILVVGKY